MSKAKIIEMPQHLPPITETRVIDGRCQYFREGLGWFVSPKDGEDVLDLD